MPTCAAFLAVSLDGHIARPDGDIAWLSLADLPGEDYGYATFFGSIDALVLGRRTYDTVRGFDAWPFGTTRCAVLTHRPAEAAHGETFHAGPLRDLLATLGAEGVQRVYADGGEVVRQALREGVLSELTLTVLPIVLGAGRRLFDETFSERRLTLIDTRSWPNGVVQLRYRADADAPPLTPPAAASRGTGDCSAAARRC